MSVLQLFGLFLSSCTSLHIYVADMDGEPDTEDDQLDDLLACLGEEEQKVERLKVKLIELGIDPDPLLTLHGSDDFTCDH